MTENFQLSLFKNKYATEPQVETRTWQQICRNFQNPQVRFEKDGLLFSPALFEPSYRLKENVKELSLLCFDVDHNADFERTQKAFDLLDCAYAIYSTHSHLRKTDKNPNAEPRYRVVLPLSCPISANDFPNLWQYAKQQTGLPFDESAKDASRMYYTPVKAEPTAPYEFYIKEGDFLDWQKLPLDAFAESKPPLNAKNANGENYNGNGQNFTNFEFHEDRHAELCRRIEQQGKDTRRGTFEMKCPAHNGEGDSSLFYDPQSNAVSCLKKPKCSYQEILRAFDLPDGKLPSRKNAEESEAKPLAIIKASEVTPKKVEWLWYPYIPKNYVTLFSGEEGVGKSWIFCAIASGITNGFLPFTERFEPQNVLIFSAEDEADDVLVPRLMKTGANLDKVFIVNERFTFDEKGLRRFEHYIAETNPVWVIIDPLFAYSDLKLDLNRPHHARYVANSIERAARKFSIAVSYLIHFNKSKGGGDARAAVSSSQEFSNAARSILLIGKDPNDETRRALIHRKHNYSPKGDAIGYQITGDETDVNFLWLGKSTLTEHEIVDRAGNADHRAEQSEAVIFLRDTLQGGKRPSSEVTAEAEKLGITKQNLRTARAKLGIKPRSEGFGKDKKWFWELPENTGLDVEKDSDQHLNANYNYKTSYDNKLALDVDDANYQHLSADNQPLNDDFFFPPGTEI